MRFIGGFLKFVSIMIMIVATGLCAVIAVDAAVLEAYLAMGLAWLCAMIVAMNVWGTGIALTNIYKLKKKNEQLEQKIEGLLLSRTVTYQNPIVSEVKAAAVEKTVVEPVVKAVEEPVAEPVDKIMEASVKAPASEKTVVVQKQESKVSADLKKRLPFAAILLVLTMAVRFFPYTELHRRLFYYRDHFLMTPYLRRTLCLELALCIILFAKKRNILLAAILGIDALVDGVNLTRQMSFYNLSSFVASLLLFVVAIAFCEIPFIKADLTKLKAIAKKVFWIPAVIKAVLFLQLIKNVIATRFDDTIFYPPTNIILSALGCFVALSIGIWLVNPYKKAKVVTSTEAGVVSDEEMPEAYCGLGKHILLCLFTFGIWYLIWTYRTTKFLNKAPNAVQYNPTSKLLLCMFVPFYQIYWFYKHGQRIDAFSKQKKLNNSDMATLCLILGIFIPIVACIIMQDRINTICTTKVSVEETPVVNNLTEQLKSYKELLDSGVITQEEFDAKKKQLLGL